MTKTVSKPSVLWFLTEIIGIITIRRSISIMNSGKQVHNKIYIVATIIIVVNRIVIVYFIRFIRIVIYNCIPLGAKCFVFQYGNSS